MVLIKEYQENMRFVKFGLMNLSFFCAQQPKSAVAISHPLDFFVNPSVCCSLHGYRSRTKVVHREHQQQPPDNASLHEQTKNGQPSLGVTRDDEGHFLTKRNFCLQGLEQSAAVPYKISKTRAAQNASNF